MFPMSVVLSEIKNNIGIITLNSEKSLHSLSKEIIENLDAILENWQNNSSVACVFLNSVGHRAFCAGGDIRQLYHGIMEHRQSNSDIATSKAAVFFAQEYALDYKIHSYKKPIVVWGNGIVMGGGLGLMAGASHRIVTEKSVLAMPEISIGLYPDVGATWFLNQMPSAYGLYLGLTATRLTPEDSLFLNLADFYVDSSKKEELLVALQNADWSENPKEIASNVISKFSKENSLNSCPTALHQSFIQLFENVSSVQNFKKILLDYPNKTSWIEAGIKFFLEGSPSSAHVIFKQLTQGKDKTLEEVFQSEWNLTAQCCVHPDLAEGIRALLIDKDLSPKWQPSTLDEVTEAWVDSYFEPLTTGDKHPLKDLGKNN